LTSFSATFGLTETIFGQTLSINSSYDSLINVKPHETTRRNFLKAAGFLTFWPAGCAHRSKHYQRVLVNDMHSQLNATLVDRVTPVESCETLRQAVIQARCRGKVICVAGGRHAMGAQQFATDGVLLDTKALARVLNFDAGQGMVEVEAGIQWPELLKFLLKMQGTMRPSGRFAKSKPARTDSVSEARWRRTFTDGVCA